MIPQPQISPELFTWEKFISRNGYSQSDIFQAFPSFKLRNDVEVIGYCPASRLKVRPRTGEGEWAVMVRIPETGDEVWAHWIHTNE